jgi:glycosyltransferase involved in cell wall biosynthesis
MISIIIPAHNESTVIARALEAITSGGQPEELDVVVVCNGCTDNTADIARRFGAPVRVLETEKASKINALNVGDAAAYGYPRIYADADVVLPLKAIRALADRLETGDILAAAPTPKPNLSKCSRVVVAFFTIRGHLPSSREGIGGSGVYALSQAGRNRFGEFPDLIADDGYVRIQFGPEERETLRDVYSVVFAPRNLGDLIKVRTRVFSGTMQLSRMFPDIWQNRGRGNGREIVKLFRFPSLWHKLILYCCINIIARHRAKNRLSRSGLAWERDDSSRKLNYS